MKKQNTEPHLASRKECTGCMACADACRHGALRMVTGADGHFYPQVDPNVCIGCGACEKVCPVQSGMPYGANRGKSKPFAAWAVDKELLSNSASGGVFAAIATHILENGGYVAGAVSTGDDVKHIVIDSCAQLHLLQGSKYLQSDTRGVYKEVKKLLVAGNTVLFSGTGCQVAGLLCFLGKKYDRLFTIDLICAGVPSRLVMSRFCKEEKLSPEYIRWRDKEDGWQHGLRLTITSEGVKKRWKRQNCFWWGGFLGGMTNRYSCYDCRFSGADRKADLTIGDYWGCKDWKEQWHDGVSVVIVHSGAGQALIESSRLETRSTTWQDCTRENPRIVLGKRPVRWMLVERRIVPWAFKHLGYGALQKIYAGNIRRNDFLWLPYKVFKLVRWRLMQRLTNKHGSKILKNL